MRDHPPGQASVRTPLSILVAPPTLDRGRLETFRDLGVDMIGIGLDAVSEFMTSCAP